MTDRGTKPRRTCVITCYSHPDYVRASTLREGARRALPGADVIVVKNTQKGVFRYIEVMVRLLLARLKHRPDVYILTFRGYEMVLPVRILTIGKPFVFDEFINLEEWLIENNKIRPNSIKHKLIAFFSRSIMRLPNLILSDTPSHADYSRKINKLPQEKVSSVIVSTDEDVFMPSDTVSASRDNELEVFFYGSKMLPLHGLNHILDAAERLSGYSINFTIIGGTDATKDEITRSMEKGARVTYKRRVSYKELSEYANRADVCLGGPFGDTLQSQFVVTGKTYQFMASGKPCIVGANLETSEASYFKDRVNCLLVPQGQPQGLAGALTWCAEHRSQLEEIGKNARQTYLDHMSIDVVAKQLHQNVFSRFFN